MLKKIVKVIWQKLNRPTRVKIVRATQQKFTVSAAAIVVNENGEVLLLDHVLRPGFSWGVPGGFVGRGEQPEAAVRRELFEETGLELKNVKLLRIRTTNRHVEILFRAGAVGTARVKSLEINGLGWFKADEMPEQMSQAQKSTVRDLLISERKTENP